MGGCGTHQSRQNNGTDSNGNTLSCGSNERCKLGNGCKFNTACRNPLNADKCRWLAGS